MISFAKFWQKMAESDKIAIICNGQIVNKKLTISLLSQITGISTQTFDAMRPIEEGKVYKRKRGCVNLSVIDKLCDFFECQIEDLIEFCED